MLSIFAREARGPVRLAPVSVLACSFLLASLMGAAGGCADSPSSSPEVDDDSDPSDDPDDGESSIDAGPRDSGAKLDASVKSDASITLPADADSTLDSGKPAVVDAGVDAAVKDTGTPDTGTPDTGTPADQTLCHLEGNEVAILGDSYIDLSGDFTIMLQDHARKAGALDATETYVDHALSGASMHGTPNIPSQFPDAVADAKMRGSKGIKAVIMTGGGNDVLINQRACLEKPTVADVEKDPICTKVVDDVLTDAQKLFDDAIAEGVKGVIYFFYPHLPKDAPLGGLLKGSYPNSMLDYSEPRAQKFCEEQTKIPCYFVDMRPAFDDPKNPGWPRDGLIGIDGVHPMAVGSQILADEVWKVMQAKCFGSK